MNKNLFRLSGAILTFEAIYIAVIFFPLIFKTLIPEPIYMVATGAVVLGVLLLFISGIGGLLVKKWAAITLWIALVLSFLVSVIIGHSYPAFVSGGFMSWVVDFFIAVFLTIERRQSK